MEKRTEPLSAWGDFRQKIRPAVRRKLKKYQCGFSCWKRTIVGAFPVLDWLVHYDIRKCFVGDLVSGCTVGIMNIPQGMAYGVLAGTEAIHGLYASFFPVLVYSIFCTSKHASVGTFAVTSLMAGGIVNSVGSEWYAKSLLPPPDIPGVVSGNASRLENYRGPDIAMDAIPLDIRVSVMIAVTLAVGLWQVLMGILRFGYLAVLLSDHLVRGFTCAAAFHVFTSQVKLVFGMNVLEKYGPLKLVYFYIEFFSKIHTTHVPTLIVSIICITVLYLTRTFINGNPKIIKVIRVPIPVELLVIIFGTLASYYLELDEVYQVKTVRDIPTGLPAPRVPSYTIIPEILGRTFSLAVVASAVLISLAKIFATKHRYKIDPNQELVAIGASNIFGSFFLCIPTTGALARSAVQESVGGSTQMVSLISALIVLIVLLAVGKFLQPLPRACLGSIIMVALINMLKQVLDLKTLFHVSLIDASIFLVTLLATLLLDVDLGLAVGVLYSLLTFAFRLQYGKVTELGRSRDKSDGFVPLDSGDAERFPGVKIFKLYGPLYSGNAESFVSRIRCVLEEGDEQPRLLVADPAECVAVNDDDAPTPPPTPEISVTSDGQVEVVVPPGIDARTGLKAIIIDCSSVNFVDVVGAQNLKLLGKDCMAKNVGLFIAGCTDDVRDVLFRAGVMSVIPEICFTPTVQAALTAVTEI